MQLLNKWWGVVLLTIGIGLLTIAVLMLGLTGYYYRQIRLGHSQEISTDLVKSFSAIAGSKKTAVTASRFEIETTSSPYRGANDAQVTVVEFLDFKCPNSKTAAPILTSLVQRYNGLVKLIVRNFPVESTHPGATKLADLGWCANQQGRFWLFHDWVYQNQDTISDAPSLEEIKNIGTAANLDVDALLTCLARPEADREVKADYFDAIRFGVRGTPTFFINGVKVEGVIEAADWDKLLSNYKK